MNARAQHPWGLGDCVALACLLEATAPKAGNVHRGADFAEMSFVDFQVSSMAVRGVFDCAGKLSTGQLIHDAVAATRRTVGRNTNLGLMLLIAPLAQAAAAGSLREGVARVLRELTADDARLVYRAIALAAPGGMGRVDEMDLADEPPDSLLDAMAAAAGRDLIAHQYTCDFEDVFALVVEPLTAAVRSGCSLTEAIIDTHLRLMAVRPDSLIGRKCGSEVARQAANGARSVLSAGPRFSEDYQKALADFDFWLRSDGHRRNPGTSADMLGAGLFVALWQGDIELPYR